MKDEVLLPHLFRIEYRKLVSVLSYMFGIQHIEIAEDIASDTFLAATEHWSIHGNPANPTAWLYTVAKNKTKNYLKRNQLFEQKLRPAIRYTSSASEEMEIDLSPKNINDSQLAMMFAVCHPGISQEAQVALALNLLCGFGVQEIADAFLTNKEVIYKRLTRAKDKLKEENFEVGQPGREQIGDRLETVLTTIYLLFSEGYYSTSQNTILRKDLCAEAMRLNVLLAENELTNQPAANALLSLMCFHASRFDARTDEAGESVLYEDQDETLWDTALIKQGENYLNLASIGSKLSRFHLEAGIAYWHTHKKDSAEKWENILQLYNELLQLAYSPIAALNRTFALAKANGKPAAIVEAKKLDLKTNHFYFSLLGHLYTEVDDSLALEHFKTALSLAASTGDKKMMQKHIDRLQQTATTVI
ncbi:MAG: sigma-70 family RNA polymerase sigma factor [Ferruginibacter sp.]|nr:sigma-70 family RNA polymerase sigma factor [Ferruginibacter sp.]